MEYEIFDREDGTPITQQVLDEFASEQFAVVDGDLIVIGDGKTTTVTAEELEAKQFELRDGWRMIRRAAYPRGK